MTDGNPRRLGKRAEDLVASLRRIPGEDSARERLRPTKEIAGLIEDLRLKHGIGRETPEQVLRDRWREIVGPVNATYSHAVRIDPGGRLVIQASHSVVRNELFMNKGEILQRVRTQPGCSTIRSLFLTNG